MRFRYRLSGLALASDMPLPFLAPGSDPTPDVTVRFAPLPQARDHMPGVGPFRVLAPDCLQFEVEGVLRVRVEHGRSLTVDAGEHADAGTIQTYLFGPAFAALLYQRGTPPLHAGAVRLATGGAVAVAGHSRAGKSTTTRALLGAGHSLLCDDQLVVDPETGMAQAGFPALKLWGNTLAHFGETGEAAPRVVQALDKYHIAYPQAFDTAPAELKAICLLLVDPALSEPALERLPGPETVAALGLMAHHSYVADAIGRRPDIFRVTAAIAARIPVYMLSRPDDFGSLDAVVRLVQQAGEAGAH